MVIEEWYGEKVKSIEESGLIIKCAGKAIKNEAKNKKADCSTFINR